MEFGRSIFDLISYYTPILEPPQHDFEGLEVRKCSVQKLHFLRDIDTAPHAIDLAHLQGHKNLVFNFLSLLVREKKRKNPSKTRWV